MDERNSLLETKIQRKLRVSSPDEELMHYGVKGMKWGVRRSQRQLDRAAGRKPSKSTTKRVNKISQKLEKKKAALEKKERKKNPTKGMSDTELRETLNRMQMERQYTQLTKTEKSNGRKAAETIFVATATTSAASLVKSGYKKAGEKVFNMLSGETAAKAVDRMVKGAS